MELTAKEPETQELTLWRALAMKPVPYSIGVRGCSQDPTMALTAKEPRDCLCDDCNKAPRLIEEIFHPDFDLCWKIMDSSLPEPLIGSHKSDATSERVVIMNYMVDLEGSYGNIVDTSIPYIYRNYLTMDTNGGGSLMGGSPTPQRQHKNISAYYNSNPKMEPRIWSLGQGDGVMESVISQLMAMHTKAFAATVGEERVKERLLASLGHFPGRSGSVLNLRALEMSRLRAVLDSGASRHAVGDSRILQNLQYFRTPRRATQPDGSPLSVVAVGTIQMESFKIPDVELVVGLRTILISVGQLDRDHGLCCCFHSGKCDIMSADGTVVGGAILEGDGMYVLRFLEIPERAQE